MDDAAIDAELATRVTRGEREAEAELCRRFAPRILLYGRKHLRSEESAGELMQSVLVAVIEALRAERVEHPEHLARFVLGTCRHLADRIRRGDARFQPGEVPPEIATVPDVELLDFGAVFRCMQHLDARAWAVLQLSFYRERTAEQIATALSTTAGNVRVVRHRAIAQLRRCVEQPREAP
jgi:RNA polymerase sigma-70 factor (ECF subfamily)